MRQALIQTQETPVSKTQLEFQPTGLGSWLFLSLHAEVTCASHYQINSLFRIGVKSPQWTFCCCSLLALLYLCKFHGDIKVETSWATCGEVAEVIFFPSLRMLHLQPGFRLISGTPLATGQLELWSKQAFQRFQYRVFLFGTYGLNSSADHWATLLQRDTHAVLWYCGGHSRASALPVMFTDMKGTFSLSWEDKQAKTDLFSSPSCVSDSDRYWRNQWNCWRK